ncbi:hypothetical protein [Quadrisphaera sp. KR29]|uniref:hypothetical protein n=1 Tax=Quadrisphaera sp. KR29 TaxID=3461391 RepID=UPI0040440F14
MALVLGVIGWLVLSPVVAVVLGVAIARAGRLAEARETMVELVPDTLPASVFEPSGDPARQPAAWSPPRPSAPGDVLQLRLSR